MTIVTRDSVRAAVNRVLLIDPDCIECAMRAAAVALCMPVEAVHDAMQLDGQFCSDDEDLVVSVCHACGDTRRTYGIASETVTEEHVDG